MSRGWASGLLGGGGAGPARAGAAERAPAAHVGLSAGSVQPSLVDDRPFVLTVGIAASLPSRSPKRYTTSCLVLVKISRVPDKILANVSDELDARRHQTIKQEILSRTRLEKVNDELHPFPKARTVTAALEAIQSGIEVNFKGSDAFTISSPTPIRPWP